MIPSPKYLYNSHPLLRSHKSVLTGSLKQTEDGDGDFLLKSDEAYHFVDFELLNE